MASIQGIPSINGNEYVANLRRASGFKYEPANPIDFSIHTLTSYKNLIQQKLEIANQELTAEMQARTRQIVNGLGKYINTYVV